MPKLQTQERRQHERFPQALDVHARCLISGQSSVNGPAEFDGRIQNLSNGGTCILSSCVLPPHVFVCCKFPVSDAPISIPILMQVRWTVKHGVRPPSYLSGLQFVV